jgi:hypothetical protein
VAHELSFVMVSMFYDTRPSYSVMQAIRGIANAVVRGPGAAIVAKFIRGAFEAERLRYIDPEIGDNKMITEIQETCLHQPDLLLRACRDSGLAFAASVRGFGLVDQQRRLRVPNDAKGKERETVRTFYFMLPALSGFFLSMNIDDPQHQVLAFVRKSDGKALEERVRRLDRISEYKIRKLGK